MLRDITFGVLIFNVCSFAAFSALAEDSGQPPKQAVAPGKDSDLATGFGAGPVISSVQQDFGVGVELISPTFARDTLAISASAKLNYLTVANWRNYGSAELSLMAGMTSPWPTGRLYAKAGVVSLFPSDAVAGDDVLLGGLGAFGFEFFFNRRREGAYFIELGGIGTAARADALNTAPVFANGFIANVGVRYYL